MSKLLDDIAEVCRSEYKGQNRKTALEMLGKMKQFKGGVTFMKMDAFVQDFRKKYAVGSIIVSRQYTKSNDCWYVSLAVGESMSSYHTMVTASLEEAYVKLCLSLFRGVKMGEYKCRDGRR